MIVASSFRPLDKCSPELVHNQLAAKQSWDALGLDVVYFNDPEPKLEGPRTVFVPTVGRPDIKRMAHFLSVQRGWGCIVNADIILGSGARHLIDTATLCCASCIVSRRYTIPNGGTTATAKLLPTDHGVDFFMARPEVWKHVTAKIPPDFQIGRIVWDTWMVCFFVTEYFWATYDATMARVVFHPDHAERIDQNINIPKDQYLTKSLWPRFLIA